MRFVAYVDSLNRSAQLADVILLIKGLMFVLDVVSPLLYDHF